MGGLLIGAGLVLGALSLFAVVDVATIDALDEIAGGSVVRWAVGAAGVLLVVGGWGIASDQ